MGDHEWCFYGWRKGAAHEFFGANNITDVWSVKKVSPQKMVHLTEKPVELAARSLQYSSRSRTTRDATTVSGLGERTASTYAAIIGSNEGQSPRLESH